MQVPVNVDNKKANVIPRLHYRLLFALTDYDLNHPKSHVRELNMKGWMVVNQISDKIGYRSDRRNLYPILDELKQQGYIEQSYKNYEDERGRRHQVSVYRLKRDGGTIGRVFEELIEHAFLVDLVNPSEKRIEEIRPFVLGKRKMSECPPLKSCDDLFSEIVRKIAKVRYFINRDVQKAQVAHIDKKIAQLEGYRKELMKGKNKTR